MFLAKIMNINLVHAKKAFIIENFKMVNCWHLCLVLSQFTGNSFLPQDMKFTCLLHK